jgi:hypothetical protein
MTGMASDLITGYLDELYAGLRVPAAEAELIAAEAEDHLRETALATAQTLGSIRFPRGIFDTGLVPLGG